MRISEVFSKEYRESARCREVLESRRNSFRLHSSEKETQISDEVLKNNTFHMSISDELMDNFDDANIAAIRSSLDKEDPVIPLVAFQKTTPCDVEISEESRRICAEALLD